jgi:hypothetical protein
VKDLLLDVIYETEKIGNMRNLNFPIRVLDGRVIYRCDNLSQFCEWLEDKEGEIQAPVVEFNRVIQVKEVNHKRQR